MTQSFVMGNDASCSTGVTLTLDSFMISLAANVHVYFVRFYLFFYVLKCIHPSCGSEIFVIPAYYAPPPPTLIERAFTPVPIGYALVILACCVVDDVNIFQGLNEIMTCIFNFM